MRQILVALLVLASAGCTTPKAPPIAENPSPSESRFNARQYRLAVGDKIRADVFGEPDLSVDTVIDATGAINFPLLGRVGVLGMTPPEMEMTLVRKLTGDYLVNPSVRVTVVQFRPIYVVGQVARAGAYSFVDGMTVEKAVAIAGGLTRLASERGLYVVREKTTRGQRLPASFDTPIYPGDTIIVEESLF